MRKSPVFSLLASSAVLLSSVALAQPRPTDPGATPPPDAEATPDAPAPADPDASPDAELPPAEAPDASPPDEPPPPSAELPSAEPPRSTFDAESAMGLPPLPEPGSDAAALVRQGAERPTDAQQEANATGGDTVFAEDWWSHSRPVFELHGYFRVRAELFHKFGIGRINQPNDQLWPLPLDHRYRGIQDPGTQAIGDYGPKLCTAKEAKLGKSTDPADGLYRCRNQMQVGANMRFRINPELHISDNLRVLTQIDMLDNVVMGSTPTGYAIQPDADGGYETVARNGYNPISLYDVTQEPPRSGVNSTQDSIEVKRVWGEYQTPLGELRFGRMPSHWGLGILANSGDGYDDDYQTTVDRLMVVTGMKSLDLYLAAAWDFPHSGAVYTDPTDPQRPAYDLAQRDDVRQWMLSVARRQNPDLMQQRLAQGKLVLNGGAYLLLRKQTLANDATGSATDGANVPNATANDLVQINNTSALVRRGARIFVPDLWLQVLYKTFRFEAEAVTVQGRADNLEAQDGTILSELEDSRFRMWGVATETEFRAIEEKLKLDFKWGWASGDPDASEDTLPGGGGLVPGTGLQDQVGDDTWSTFAFHPNYKVDLILHRNLLSRVQGTYYFRPGVQYDFMRTPDGQRLGGGFAAIWTRASSFLQTPGHKRDLGIELNGKVYFQAKDGALNDVPGKTGGFYTQLEYGVLFPLGGLGYQEREKADLQRALNSGNAGDTKAAQIFRWYVGVLF